MKKVCLSSWLLLFISIFSLPGTLLSQNVGIGTSTPTRAKLEVHGASGSTNAIFGGDGAGISLQRNWPAIGFNEYYTGAARYIANGYAVVQSQDQSNGNLVFDLFPSGSKDAIASSYQRALLISVEGNVGIRTNPTNAATLYVVKAGNLGGSAILGGSMYNSHFNYDVAEDTYIRGGKTGSRVIINNVIDGKVLIGSGISHVSINNGIPTYPLEIRQVNGVGIKLFEPANNLNGWELRVQRPLPSTFDDLYMIYNNQYKCYFEGGYLYTYSDKRLKTNIRDIPSIMEKFMQLQPVEYNMKSYPTAQKKTTGFIAQDVQQLFPQLVAVNRSRHGYTGVDELYGLNYDGFRMLTIKAIQEQQEKIKEMQQLNEVLEKKIAAAEELLKKDKQ